MRCSIWESAKNGYIKKVLQISELVTHISEKNMLEMISEWKNYEWIFDEISLQLQMIELVTGHKLIELFGGLFK
jgi:hypothetical protein